MCTSKAYQCSFVERFYAFCLQYAPLQIASNKYRVLAIIAVAII